MAGNFTIEVNGTASVVARLKGDVAVAKEFARNLTTKAATEGARTMRFLAPRGAGDTHLGYDTLESRISSTNAVWHPGGVGGGGYYEAKAGVRRSPRFPDPKRDPASWVYEGTGLYGPRHRMIVARAGNFMVFKWQGRWFFMREIKGQEPQTLWVSAARERANAYVVSGLARFAAAMRRKQGTLP